MTVKELKRILDGYNEDAIVIGVDWTNGDEFNVGIDSDDEDEFTKYCRISLE